MSRRKKDELYDIFIMFLTQAEKPDVAEVIHNTVAEYIFKLFSKGDVPQGILDELEYDLSEEVFDMYLKKTYGQFMPSDSLKKIITEPKRRSIPC